MWVNTWVVLLVVVGWIVTAFVASGHNPTWWATAGAIGIATALPALLYPWSKGFVLHLLHRIDPPR
jgi:hypothetical protein